MTAPDLRQDLQVGPSAAIERASKGLVDQLRRHDPPTQAHCERVAHLADLIGATLSLTEDERARLRLAALLHDVGKLAVPRHLLAKRCRPDDGEWELIRTHPTEGEVLLAPLEPWLGEWIGAARDHHERFDGSGYPHGRAGREISLAGRIVAVADAYDCIVSIRAYKSADSVEHARSELAAGRGTQFDPQVVDAFLAAGHLLRGRPA